MAAIYQVGKMFKMIPSYVFGSLFCGIGEPARIFFFLFALVT